MPNTPAPIKLTCGRFHTAEEILAAAGSIYGARQGEKPHGRPKVATLCRHGNEFPSAREARACRCGQAPVVALLEDAASVDDAAAEFRPTRCPRCRMLYASRASASACTCSGL